MRVQEKQGFDPSPPGENDARIKGDNFIVEN